MNVEDQQAQLSEDFCSCVWGYDSGHDYCASPDEDCVVHGCSEAAYQSEEALRFNAALNALEAHASVTL